MASGDIDNDDVSDSDLLFAELKAINDSLTEIARYGRFQYLLTVFTLSVGGTSAVALAIYFLTS